MTVEMVAGTRFDHALRESVALAKRLKVGVKFVHNGEKVIVWPDQDYDELIKRY